MVALTEVEGPDEKNAHKNGGGAVLATCHDQVEVVDSVEESGDKESHGSRRVGAQIFLSVGDVIDAEDKLQHVSKS